MRRIVAALAALLLLAASPAHAYSVLVTTATTPGNSSDNRGHSNYLRAIRNVLDSQGVQYDVIRGDALTTAQVAAGSVTFGGVTRTYDAVIVTSFTKGTTTYVTGFQPDQLTLTANWPTIPVLLVAAHWAVSGYQNSATCSTGVLNAIGAPFGDGTNGMGTGNGYVRSCYVTGRAEPWKTYDGMWPQNINPAATWSGRILRPLVQAAISTASGTGASTTCTDCDGMTRSASDSSTLWRISRKSSAGSETGVPIFMAFPTMNGGSGGANFSSGLMGMAVAALDSATRLTGSTSEPKVIGSRAGWQPRRLAIALTHVGGHSSGAAESFDGESGGANWRDSTNFKAVYRDSLGSLGIPITAFYNADRDTVAAYPNELAFYKTLRLAKFAPAITRGVFSSTAGVTANSVGAPIDVWGRQRTRWLYSSDCTTDTGSVYCGLQRIKALNDSLFAGRTVNTLYAPAWDWIPSQYSRAFLPTRDSLVTIATLLGFNSLVVSPEATEQSPGASYNLQQGGGSVFSTSATNPTGLFNNDQRVTAYRDFSKTVYAGTFNFPASRGRWGEAASVNIDGAAGHEWAEEFLWGAMSTAGPWWISPYPYYYHNFYTRLSVMEVPVNLLGGTTPGTKRYGWWQIKWAVNQVKAMNALAGRNVAIFTYTDDL